MASAPASCSGWPSCFPWPPGSYRPSLPPTSRPGSPRESRARSSSPIPRSIRSPETSISSGARLRSRAGGSWWRTAALRAGRSPSPGRSPPTGSRPIPGSRPDGHTLWFISSRSTDGVKRKDLDIWKVERDASGKWGVPVRLPLRSIPRAPNGFPARRRRAGCTSARTGPEASARTTSGGTVEANGEWIVENLGPAINTPGDEYEPLPSPDGSRLIVMAADGLYESRLRDNGGRRRRAPSRGQHRPHGDRRRVLAVGQDAALRARHERSGLGRVLPAPRICPRTGRRPVPRRRSPEARHQAMP